MTNHSDPVVTGAQSVSIRKSNGAVAQIIRSQADGYLARGWKLDTIHTIGNGVYNVILSRPDHQEG